MILRRFMQHIKEQNWFAVGLDVLVVIVGIFLGMQVTDWNEKRKDRIAEREYLVRILADFDRSIALQKDSLEFFDQNITDFEFVVERLTQGELSAEDRPYFVRGLATGGRVNPIPFVRTAFQELQSSGRIGILQNTELRSELSNIFAFFDFKLEQMQYPNEALLTARTYTYQYYFADRDFGVFDFEQMRASEPFLYAINWMQKRYKTIRLFHFEFHQETLRVRNLLADYLKETK